MDSKSRPTFDVDNTKTNDVTTSNIAQIERFLVEVDAHIIDKYNLSLPAWSEIMRYYTDEELDLFGKCIRYYMYQTGSPGYNSSLVNAFEKELSSRAFEEVILEE